MCNLPSLSIPKSNFCNGARNDWFFCVYHGFDRYAATKGFPQVLHSRICNFVLCLGGEHQWNECCVSSVLINPALVSCGSKNHSGTLGSVSLTWACWHPIVSTGATKRDRISLIVAYVSLQFEGAGCGWSKSWRMAFTFFGVWASRFCRVEDVPDGTA